MAVLATGSITCHHAAWKSVHPDLAEHPSHEPPQPRPPEWVDERQPDTTDPTALASISTRVRPCLRSSVTSVFLSRLSGVHAAVCSRLSGALSVAKGQRPRQLLHSLPHGSQRPAGLGSALTHLSPAVVQRGLWECVRKKLLIFFIFTFQPSPEMFVHASYRSFTNNSCLIQM